MKLEPTTLLRAVVFSACVLSACGTPPPKPKALPPQVYPTRLDCEERLDDCVRACRDRHHRKSCRSLAFAYLNGDGRRAPDYPRAISLFERICERGDNFICGMLGHALSNFSHAVTNRERGQKLLTKACRKGSASACTNLAYHLSRFHPETAKNNRRRLKLNRYACNRGKNAVACLNTALLYYSPKRGLRPNWIMARYYIHRACRGGNAKACHLRQRWLERQLYRRYRWAFKRADRNRRACRKGDRKACVHFGVAVMVARWLRRNRGIKMPNILRLATSPHTVLTLSDACQKSHAMACLFLADVYRRGAYRLRRDPIRAERLLVRACKLPSRTGNAACVYLGSSRLQGENRNSNVDQALLAFDVACRRGYAKACAMAGYAALHRKKKLVARGLAYHRRACDLGSGYSCRILAWYHERGKYLPADLEQAKLFYRRGCAAGYKPSCRALTRLAPGEPLPKAGPRYRRWSPEKGAVVPGDNERRRRSSRGRQLKQPPTED